MVLTDGQTTLVHMITTETIWMPQILHWKVAATVMVPLSSFTWSTRLRTAHRPATVTMWPPLGLQLLGYFSATPACSRQFQIISTAPFSSRSVLVFHYSPFASALTFVLVTVDSRFCFITPCWA